MKTYKLALEKIPEVKGEFKTIYNDGEFVYVQGINKEELESPFILSELPSVYEEKLKENLEYEKVRKIGELNATCDRLLGSFSSDALGETYIYDGKQEDQINLMGLVIAGVDGFFRCAKISNPTDKQNYPHTKEQIKKVYSDGLKIKSETIYKCGILKDYLKTLNSIDEVKSIKWEEYEKIKGIFDK